MLDPADEAPLTHSRVSSALVLYGCRVVCLLSRIHAGRDADEAIRTLAVVRRAGEPDTVQTTLHVARAQRPRLREGLARPRHIAQPNKDQRQAQVDLQIARPLGDGLPRNGHCLQVLLAGEERPRQQVEQQIDDC